MAEIWNTDNTYCWRGCYSNRNSHSWLVRTQNGVASLDGSSVLFYKTKHILSACFSNHASWYLPKGIESLCACKNLHTVIYSSFIHNFPSWKQPKYLSVGGWINKLWHFQTMDYYAALKRNELSSHEMTWKTLKCILPSERSQSEKVTYYMIPTIWHPGKDKNMEIVRQSVVARSFI